VIRRSECDPLVYEDSEYGSCTPPMCAELLVFNYLMCAADLIIDCQLHSDRAVAWTELRVACWGKVIMRLGQTFPYDSCPLPENSACLYDIYRWLPGALRNHSAVYEETDEVLPIEKLQFNPFGFVRSADAPYGYALTKSSK
jgi:hypothetical protein